MRFGAKSRVIFNALRDNAKASLRQVAVPTGRSKRSVHRLGQAIARRKCHPESWWWETEEGRRWFLRLGVAVLYGFGRQRGGGAETIRALFVRLPLERPVGCAPRALRGMMEARARVLLATAEAWEGEGSAGGEPRPLSGAVAAPFLARMRGVGMALVSGSLVVAEVAADRPYATWDTLVEARLEAGRVRGWSLVRARAQAPVQLAETGVDGLSLPEVFPLIHALVTSSALAMGRRLPQARRDVDHAQKPRCPCLVSPSRAPTRHHAQARGEAWGAAVTRWESVRLAYRRHLERGSLIVHPWRLVDATRQRAPEVERQVHAESNALAA